MSISQRIHRVLIIDDTPHIHKSIRRMLRDVSPIRVEIDSAYQGQEGAELVRQAQKEGRPYTFAFVDIRMPPGWDGFVTIEHLWAHVPTCDIVICTGYSDYSWSDIVHRLGSSERLLLLKKPFDAIEVLQITHNLARRRELRERIEEETARRQRIEMELRHAQRMESVGHLASGIAHEINTPIQFIHDSMSFLRESFSDLLLLVDKYRQSVSEAAHSPPLSQWVSEIHTAEKAMDIEFVRTEVPEALDRVVDGLQRVAAIVGAMKEFSHPGDTKKSSVDLNRAIENTLTIARSEYKHVATVSTDLRDIPPVVCSIQEINQVLLNLVINAAHAIESATKNNRREGCITVGTKRTENAVAISVSDNGVGIPESIRDRIFDPFFTTKEVGEGTGQGLAIAWSVVVDKHGGKILVNANEPCGTTFTILLPLQQDNNQKCATK